MCMFYFTVCVQMVHLNFFLLFLQQTDALKCVAQASKNRSLADFEKVRTADVIVITLANAVLSLLLNPVSFACHTREGTD